ncbi:putative sodium-coupled neutral amino acid transporter 10 [Rhipicephalus sanguineus]|uniref:putative sodium-coupled neutral amino acid transporter 10 n=1 Tax=Rhipicephalus sanguineus TaxID=34632 RepID=UPI0020C4FF8C|nr:putative sodium-coupled neutral amino acid transporter 10 [Rhipicephalus sanguineus]
MTAADMAWSSSLKNTINLGNSIIGVSILAMPYCFEKCGIVLSSLLLLVSGLLTRMTCHLLLKSAITARRRNYEFLAFHTFGPTGKLVVEIGILGFLLGSCVAFFVVMGDLAPPLASDFFLLEASPRLRLTVLLLLGTCVGLPLGLLRNLDSLTSLSALSLGFYCLLVLKVFLESFPVLWSGAWWDRVVLWRHENLLSVLPIFAMALSCQPQLFEIFDTVNEPSLKRMNSVVNGAVQMCSMVYIMMGFFGYVAFCGGGGPLPGNVLIRLGSSLASEFIKLGFVATLVVSFPLCLFPCRTSLHSLLFKRGSKFHDPSYDYIPDGQFRLLTVLLVGATLATACLVPNIEIVLGLTGSTIGTLICVIMPALVFTRVQPKSTNERLVAKFLSWAGLCIMIGCTMTTLSQVRPPDRGSAPSRLNPLAVVVSRPAPLLR